VFAGVFGSLLGGGARPTRCLDQSVQIFSLYLGFLEVLFAPLNPPFQAFDFLP
jgi:hypothetical protein